MCMCMQEISFGPKLRTMGINKLKFFTQSVCTFLRRTLQKLMQSHLQRKKNSRGVTIMLLIYSIVALCLRRVPCNLKSINGSYIFENLGTISAFQDKARNSGQMDTAHGTILVALGGRKNSLVSVILFYSLKTSAQTKDI